MIIRRLARPLLAANFVVDGIDTLRHPEPRAKAAASLVSRGQQSLSPQLAEKLPSEPGQIVRVNAAAQVGAGVLLAMGRLPRLSALVLACTVVPATVTEQDFWNETDPDRRATKRVAFLKDLGLLGGLIIASADTAGKPSLGWRGRRAARQAAAALPFVGPTSGEALRDRLQQQAAHGRELALTAADKGAVLAEVARQRGAELAVPAKEHGAEWAERAKHRGAELAEVAKQRGGELAEVAKHRGAELAEVTKQRGSELAVPAKEHGYELAGRAKHRGAELAEVAKQRGSALVDTAEERGSEWAERGKRRGAAAAQTAQHRGGRWADRAKHRGAELTELAKQRGAEWGDTAQHYGADLEGRTRKRGRQLARTARERRAEVAAIARQRAALAAAEAAALADQAKDRGAEVAGSRGRGKFGRR
ncbi:DoxX family membrane protein [Nocardia wallacei]|uniref:DoxX family membrane protein n=1 Tax=Nocardia wallacei TaxID=480035 RepID=UPI002453D361|nr:DoxX family membrane protein [Nocardia wallacei]